MEPQGAKASREAKRLPGCANSKPRAAGWAIQAPPGSPLSLRRKNSLPPRPLWPYLRSGNRSGPTPFLTARRTGMVQAAVPLSQGVFPP